MKTVWITLVCLLLAACSSVPISYYWLQSLATQQQWTVPVLGLQVGPVSLPPWLDRPELAVSRADGRVDVYGQKLWAAPLDRMIASVLATRLAQALPALRINPWPQATPFAPQALLTIDIQSLDEWPGGQLRLLGVWSLWRGDKLQTSANFSVSHPLSASSIEARLATENQLLATLADQLAAALAASLCEPVVNG